MKREKIQEKDWLGEGNNIRKVASVPKRVKK